MARILVTGGVRSGKSRYAEGLLPSDAPVTYLTPGYPADHDPEWAARVAAHRLRRPPAWSTIEASDLATALDAIDTPVLIDCLGTWLSRLIDGWQAWDASEAELVERVGIETTALVEAISGHADVVIVTNEVGWGVVPDHRAGRVFSDNLGRINQAVATACGEVILMVAGRPLRV